MTTPDPKTLEGAQPFKREDRYIVIKRSDLAGWVNDHGRLWLELILRAADSSRNRAGKPPLECVVVESDWPEYEPTWKAIEARMTGAAPPQLNDVAMREAFKAEYYMWNLEPSEVEGRAFKDPRTNCAWQVYKDLAPLLATHTAASPRTGHGTAEAGGDGELWHGVSVDFADQLLTRLALLDQAWIALRIAGEICDAVPNRAHEVVAEPLRSIGALVNSPDANGHTRYAIIRDAFVTVDAYLKTVKPSKDRPGSALSPQPVSAEDVEALRKDAERLNWLELNPEHPYHPMFDSGWKIAQLEGPLFQLGAGVMHYSYESLRAAIDAAMEPRHD